MVNKNTKINEYSYIVAVMGGAMLVALILVLVAGKPLYLSLKQTNRELDEKKLVLEKLETNLVNLKGLASRKVEIEERNKKVLAALPANQDVPRLFVQMERIASGAGLQITNVSEGSSADSAAQTSPIGVATITPHFYTITGKAENYGSLKTSLQKIETGLRLVSVEKLDIQSAQSGKGLSVNFIVKTYSRGE
jgi:Tfp pilus assembly protein PilO